MKGTDTLCMPRQVFLYESSEVSKHWVDVVIDLQDDAVYLSKSAQPILIKGLILEEMITIALTRSEYSKAGDLLNRLFEMSAAETCLQQASAYSIHMLSGKQSTVINKLPTSSLKIPSKSFQPLWESNMTASSYPLFELLSVFGESYSDPMHHLCTWVTWTSLSKALLTQI